MLAQEERKKTIIDTKRISGLFFMEYSHYRRETMTANQRTPLYDWHASGGATFSVFHGWNMPLWYPQGAKKEHLSVLTTAGVFDTSHMGAISITGPDAFEFLQHCFTKDLSNCLGAAKAPLKAGRCVYGVFLNERGETIDDAIVFHLAPERYFVVVNAGMSPAVTAHLQKNAGSRKVSVGDVSEKMAKIDLQGPLSARILAKVLKDKAVPLRDMVYFSFKGDFDYRSGFSGVSLADGPQIMVSRTGYTGEFGFEIFVNPADALQVWKTVLAAGGEFGITPCGLAARDSLRAGAVLPLSGQDIGAWPYINHPWHFALPFNEEGSEFTKRFIGESVLQLRDSAEHTIAYAGYDPRKVAKEEGAIVLDKDDREIGVVLTCVADLAIGRVNGRIYSIASPDRPQDFKSLGLCCGFIKAKANLPTGTPIFLKDKRRRLQAEILNDVRPDRTARRPIKEFLDKEQS